MRFIYAALMAAFLAFPAQAAQQENVWRMITTHTVFFGSSTAVSTTDNFASGTRRVQLVCTADCLIAFAASPTIGTTEALVVVATAATTHFLPADVVKEYIVSGSQVVVVLGLSGLGTLYVTELSK